MIVKITYARMFAFPRNMSKYAFTSLAESKNTIRTPFGFRASSLAPSDQELTGGGGPECVVEPATIREATNYHLAGYSSKVLFLGDNKEDLPWENGFSCPLAFLSTFV